MRVRARARAKVRLRLRGKEGVRGVVVMNRARSRDPKKSANEGRFEIEGNVRRNFS